MTNSTNRKQISFHKKEMQYGIVAITLLLSVVAMINMETAHATTTVTTNPSVSCGPRDWGLKESVLSDATEGTAGDGSFTDDSDVDGTNDTTYQGRTNAAKLQASLNTNAEVGDLAWNAIIQGENPWGVSDQDAGAQNHNSNFDNLNSDQATDYWLKTQWVWTNVQKPKNGDNIVVNHLTDLWFKKDASTYLVIDFLVDRTASSGGNWVQESISDASWLFGASGTQYYEPFCDLVSGKTIYHFNVVLDNDTTESAGSWYEVNTNIEDEINWAFDYAGYDSFDGSCSADPGTRAQFSKIIDQESGIEIQGRGDPTGTSSVEGGISWSELYY